MKRTPLRRTSGLDRKTPLRSRTRLRSTTGLERSGPPRPVSDKRRAEQRQRREAIERMVAERGEGCEARVKGVCTGRAQDAHELLRRSQGGDPTEPDLLVCRACHDWIGANPQAAVDAGLARWSWQEGG